MASWRTIPLLTSSTAQQGLDDHPVKVRPGQAVTVLSQPASVIYNIVILRHPHDELNVGAVKDVSKPSGICGSQTVQHVLRLHTAQSDGDDPINRLAGDWT